MAPFLNTATSFMINFFPINLCRSTNVGTVIANDFSKLRSISMNRIFYSVSENAFRWFCAQRWLTDYIESCDRIWWDNILYSICRYILLAVKFYAYIYGGALDGFVLSRAVNNCKRFFLDKRERWVVFRSISQLITVKFWMEFIA